MVLNVTMVMSNKILSRGTQLAQNQWCEKEIEKRNNTPFLQQTQMRIQNPIKHQN